MSLTLLILRHAESGMHAASDHERVLTEHGQQQAKFVGEYMAEEGIQPDLILCSSAVRAMQTMQLALEAGELDTDSTVIDALYESSPEIVISLLAQVSASDSTVMIIGHEPTWSMLASGLSAEAVSFSTAALCCLRFETDSWDNIRPENCYLDWCNQP